MRGEYKVWDTVQRLDGAPVANVYHFVAEKEHIIRIPERVRPVIAFEDGVKIKTFNPKFLVPSLDPLPGVKQWTDIHFLYRLSPAYRTAQQWFDEVDAAEDAALWLPDKTWASKWVTKKRQSYVFVAIQVPIDHSKAIIGQVIAAFRPDYVHFPFSEDYPEDRLKKIEHYGNTMAGGKLFATNTIVYSDRSRRRFVQLNAEPA